jgi:hypothetical protein
LHASHTKDSRVAGFQADGTCNALLTFWGNDPKALPTR